MQHLIGHVPVKRRSRFRETAVTLWCNDGHFPVNSANCSHTLPEALSTTQGLSKYSTTTGLAMA